MAQTRSRPQSASTWQDAPTVGKGWHVPHTAVGPTAQYVLAHCALAPHAEPVVNVPAGGTQAVTGLPSKKSVHASDG
jgi:hypothetical protein